MSRYKTIQTEFTNRECLEAALNDLRLPFETHAENDIPLYGDSPRRMKANFVIRREHLAPRWGNKAYGDMGFVKEGDRFSLVLDDYDENREPVLQLVGQLRQAYAIHNYIQKARKLGYAIIKTPAPGGVIRIQLKKSGANMHEIDSQIALDGQITATVKGVPGPKCADVSKWLDQLGQVTEDRQTPDYGRRAVITQPQIARR